MKSWVRSLLVLLTVVWLAACAGVASRPLGIPSSSAPKFFASMESVGAAHGMMISRHPDSLNLKTSEGEWLQYMIKQDRIDIVVIANTDGLTEAQIEARQRELFGLSDKLVAEARSNAAQSKVFE